MVTCSPGFAKMKLISAMGVLVFSQISGAPHEDAIRAELVRKQAERQAVMVRRTQEHFNDYTQKQAENKTGCADVGFRFDTNPVPRTIVTSFPGSGNTWLRHLIHMGTGFYTGSVYNDAKLIGQGFKGEHLPWNDTRTVGVKMHQYGIANKLSAQSGEKTQNVFPKTLLLIRNPLRAILSEFNRVNNRGHSHTGAADDKLFEDGTFHAFLKQQLPRWGRSISKWLVEYRGEVHTVCYERMKEETLEVVNGLVAFMEVPMARSRCIKKSKKATGSFKRVSNHSDVTDMIKDNIELKHLAKFVIDGVSESLKSKDLEDCTQYFE